jgi:uncharacterized protein YjbI with pentapeptide repeats/cytoskeletal protein CcmA (bactofilin family)
MPQPTRSEIETGAKAGRAFEHSDLRNVQLEGAMLVGIKLARADLDGANLGNADLSGADLAGATLREAYLAGAKLADAGLVKADLDGANLKGADLSGADLTRANLSGANLEAANLQGARLRYAQLDAAVLGRANLTGAILCHADLEEADLGGANARGANLERANLRGANLEHARLDGANLERAFCQGARMVGAVARDARMQETDLGGARLRDCDFGGADLRYAVLTDADLHGTVLTGAKVHGIELAGLPAEVIVEWADGSPNGDGSQLLDARQVRRLVGDEPSAQPQTQRYLGEGDVIRNAELRFADTAAVHIESELVGCTIQLAPDAELVLGERGTMRDCTIVGGRLTIHGRFFEGGRTGLRDPRSLVVSKTGVLASRIQQPTQPTQFAFERGCRLRLDISGSDPLAHVPGKRSTMADTHEKKTYVEEGTEFVGTLRAKCPVVVKGSLEGDLEAPAVSVTATGRVTGNVKAKRVESEGVLAGSIEADEICLAGSVKSNTVIRARSFEVKLSAERGKLEVTFGECIVEVGDMPSAEDRPATTESAQDAVKAATEDEPSKRARKRRGDGAADGDATDTTEQPGEIMKIGPNGADPHPLV